MARITEREARSCWPGIFLEEDEMVDYLKIDWVKFNKSQNTHRVGVLINEIQIVTWSGPVVASRTVDRGWSISCRLHSEALAELAGFCAKVDRFIATETARIEAEEEAKNWIAVPWQDVVWLQGLGSKIRHTPLGGEEPRLVECKLSNDVSAFATWEVDKRTLPAGYDPEKPRWVDIKWADTNHLDMAKCSIRARVDGKWVSLDEYCRVFDKMHQEHYYQVDIHTLLPGVPLHEEPKPVSRPCKLGFAAAYPKESEYRSKSTVGGYDWSIWRPMSAYVFVVGLDYEFRTTAPAENKTRVVAETPVTLLGDSHIRFDYEFIKKSMVKESVNKNPRLALIVDEDS